jgi:putative membrane protein
MPSLQELLLPPAIRKNDKLARTLILTVSITVFALVVVLGRVKWLIDLGFDKHIFAQFNAIVNSIVALLLLIALLAVKRKNYLLHKRLMLTAIVLSVLFLVSYICHHLFNEETKFGGVGSIRWIYFFILSTHIVLAAIILPFVLFTAYRALVAEFPAHRKLARITWPIWFYVSVTGVLVYLMISPYYR